MSSHSLGNDIFEHPRVGQVRVSTVAFSEPQSYSIAAAPGMSYDAETIIFVGPWLEARVAGLLRYRDIDRARAAHVGVLKRAVRGSRDNTREDGQA